MTALCLALCLLLCACDKTTDERPDKEQSVGSGVFTQAVTEINPDEIVPVEGTEATIDNPERDGLYGYLDCNERQKTYYRIMLTMVRNLTEGFVKLGDDDDNPNRNVATAYRALIADFPQYYWAPFSYYIAADEGRISVAFKKSSPENGYAYEAFQIENNRTEWEDIIDLLTTRAAKEATDFQKALLLHDELCARVVYTDGDESSLYTAYGALVNGQAVCEGYAKAYAVLCRKIGLSCRTVSGTSKGVGHLWNMVKLDGKWYHVDVTWDDLRKEPLHTYFGLTDKQILIDHDINPDQKEPSSQGIAEGRSFNFGLPKAQDGDAYYFRANGLIFDEADTESVAAACATAFHAGKTYAEFAFTDEAQFTRFKETYKDRVVAVQAGLVQLLGGVLCKLNTISFTPTTCVIYWENT